MLHAVVQAPAVLPLQDPPPDERLGYADMAACLLPLANGERAPDQSLETLSASMHSMIGVAKSAIWAPPVHDMVRFRRD